MPWEGLHSLGALRFLSGNLTNLDQLILDMLTKWSEMSEVTDRKRRRPNSIKNRLQIRLNWDREGHLPMMWSGLPDTTCNSTTCMHLVAQIPKRHGQEELPLWVLGSKQALFPVAAAKGRGVLEHLSSKEAQSHISYEPACSQQ